MSELSQIIGKRLRAARLAAQLSQETLAERCGLHPSYIGQLERGEKNATIESIQKIAGGLGITISSLFEQTETHETADCTRIAREAFELFATLPPKKQEKLMELVKTALSL